MAKIIKDKEVDIVDNEEVRKIVISGPTDPIYEPLVITEEEFYLEPNGRYPDAYLLKALEKAGGNVTRASKLIGVDRSIYYRRTADNPEFLDKIQEIREIKLDFAEDKLFEHVRDGNLIAVQFMLRTLGKHRGYTTQTEIVGNDDKPLNININMGGDDMDDYS